MKLNHSELQLETLAARLVRDEIDLQPDFQRNEVWSIPKKQKLIDTILRDWAVPPVFLISRNNGDSEEVLDGQQRLTAIRDFFSDNLKIDGCSKPENDYIKNIHEFRYSDLPDPLKKKINRFLVKVYTIEEYEPDEASELFYRLNQPTALTAGEQRNALYGERRNQMKSIVDFMLDQGLDSSVLGFSNSRLAYDDVIARALVVFNIETIRVKISEKLITDEFRRNEKFDELVINKLKFVLKEISSCAPKFKLKFNKASLLSVLIACYYGASIDKVLKFLSKDFNFGSDYHVSSWEGLYHIFNDRASSRVTDISSVVIRDFCLHCVSADHSDRFSLEADELFFNVLNSLEIGFDFMKYEVIADVEKIIMDSGWGENK